MAVEKLIFRKRSDLEEFFTENRLWEDLYYDLYFNIVVRLEKTFIEEEPDALKIMNDTYSQCLRILEDKYPDDKFFTKYLKKLHNTLCNNTENSMMVLSICYAVLALSNHNNQKNIKSFLKRTKVYFGEGHYIFVEVEKFIENNTRIYDFSLRIEPMTPGEIDYEWGSDVGVFWKDVMDNNITSKKIKEILSFYKTSEDKRRVLRQIGDAIEIDHLYLRDEHTGYMEALNELESQKGGSRELHADAQPNPNESVSPHSSKTEISCLQEENKKLKEKLLSVTQILNTLEEQRNTLENTCRTQAEIINLNKQEDAELSLYYSRKVISDFVDIVISSNDPDLCKQVELALSRYNIEKEFIYNEELKKLSDFQNQIRHTDLPNVINTQGGPAIVGGNFENPQFIAQKQLESK